MKLFLAIFLLFILPDIFPQDSTFFRNDSLRILNDSLRISIDTIRLADTVTQKKYDVDTVIYAKSSDSLVFFIKKRVMNLYGKSELQYKETDLKSGNIRVDFNTNNIEAVGVPNDTVPGKVGDTPVLSEKGEVYEGQRMTYNFKTLKGFISSAETEMEGAIYSGEKIKKVDKDTYFIEDGIYTTCNADTPHYCFYGSEMKVIHKEQIISRWIWLYFGGVPFPVPIPFAVFPIESGRRSGILPPAFGDNANYGRYFSRFGYFWAISDYLDINATADYFTRGSYNVNSRFRYYKRYDLSGELNGGYSNFVSGEASDLNRSRSVNWNIRWNHNQEIDPTMRFDANLQFMSGKDYNLRTSTNLNDVLNRNIESNANFFKSWEEAGTSLSLSYTRNQNLDNGNIDERLPSLTFNKSQSYPFRSKNSVGQQKWYELFGYSYSGNFLNKRTKTNGFLNTIGGIAHQVGFSFSPKVGYISLTPNLSYTENWYNKRTVVEKISSPQTGRDTIIERDDYEINMVRTFRTGLSASTKFYGIFQPNTFGISAIRHTVSPSISYNFTPDFSKAFWGYYDTYTDTNGNVQKYDKFRREIFGGVSARESQSISLSIGNNVEMKTTVDPTDTSSQEKKIQLLNFDVSTGYDFAADSLNFAPLRLGFRTQVADFFSFSGGSTFSFYDWAPGKREINEFLISKGKGLARLTDFNITITTSLSGDKLKSKEPDKTIQPQAPESDYDMTRRNSTYENIYQEREPDFTIPWNVDLSYTYYMSKPTPLQVLKTSTLSGSVNFNLTPNWKFSFTGSYDIINKQIAAPQIVISRDLHCWLMNFSWNPIGAYRGYRFEIRVKAPQLQDLKITKRDSFYSGK